MMAPREFRVQLKGQFYTYGLLDDTGNYCYNLTYACEVAERLYGEDWVAVSNGTEGMDREEFVFDSFLEKGSSYV